MLDKLIVLFNSPTLYDIDIVSCNLYKVHFGNYGNISATIVEKNGWHWISCVLD